MTKYLLFVSIIILGLSCNDQKASSSKTPEAKPKVATTKSYPRIPNELMMKVWDEGTMIDYLFHELPFSMSQNEQLSIRTNLTYISEEIVPDIPKSCKPIARQFYQVGSDILFEADIYFSEGCQFYVFIVDNKPTYANQMAPSGVAFFNNMISQAMKARDGVGQ